MSFLTEFNALNIVNVTKTANNITDSNPNSYNATIKPLDRVGCDYQGTLSVNGHAIENRQEITIDNFDVSVKDIWVETVMSLLENNLANNKVFSDNMGLNFDHMVIDTKVKYSTPLKPLKVVSDKVLQQKSEGWQYCYDITNPEDRQDFTIKHLRQVRGYINGKLYPLFSEIGKCEVNPDRVIAKIPNFKVSPSLKTVSKIVPINLMGLTELSDQLNIENVVKLHNMILTCHNKGLVTLSYGDYTYNLGVIGLHKVISHQYVDQTQCKIAHYFNEIGVSRYANGTTLITQGDKGKVSQINLIHNDITKRYGKGWQIVKDNTDIVIVTSTHKVITLCKLVDNGLTATPSTFPIYDGILQALTVDNLLGQVSRHIGRYLKLYTSLECDKTAKTFNDKLLKTYIKCYVYSTLTLQGYNPDCNFSLDVNVIRKMLPSDQFLTTSKLQDKLTQAINGNGMQKVKDTVIQTKKLLQQDNLNPDFLTMM